MGGGGGNRGGNNQQAGGMGFNNRGGQFNGNPRGQLDPRVETDQMRRELQQRIAEAEQLARDLKQGQDVKPLEQAIQGMRNLTSNFTSLEDKNAERVLRTQVVEGLKAYEYALRRANGDEAGQRVLLERSGDVPPAFKALVEEYYRSLSRPANKKPEPPPKP